MYLVECKCGWRQEQLADRKAAEVAGDQHEGFRVVRPYAHDTRVVEVTR